MSDINKLIEQIGGRERLEYIVNFGAKFPNETVVMARALLAVLDAPVLGYIHKSVWLESKKAVCSGDEFGLEAYRDADNHFAVYATPPVKPGDN